jgi:4-diphosphocytidyl-2-C-methyl-D-erythritol kinase
LADQLWIELASRWELTVSGPFASHLSPETNSICRAQAGLEALGVAWPSGWRVHLVKEIPVAAGLGGGSMDAAAWLRFAGEVAAATRPHLVRLAESLGADVPFGLTGGMARGRGYGQRLTRVDAPALGSRLVVLANPGHPVATRDVYQAVDALQLAGRGANLDELVEALAAGAWQLEWENGLEPAAWAVAPWLRDFAQALQGFSHRRWWLSGSGGTYFTVCADEEEATWLAARINRVEVAWSRVARFHFPPAR